MPTLNWIGKDKVLTHHTEVPYRVLDRKYTFGDTPDSGNMIIHGDNLEALKSLLPRYENRIKCIYIDPPYNTGNEGWVYNDNVNDPHIRKWLGEIVGKESEDLTRHDKWLCMMYPRLMLLQRLLSEDGVIFISIDDNEVTNLRMICDEIFGKTHYLNTLVWRKNSTTVMLNKEGFSNCTEYILVYKKSDKPLRILNDEISEKLAKSYNKDDGDGRGPYGTVHLYTKTNGNKLKTLLMPDGSYFEAQWQVTQETFDEYVRQGLVIKTPSGWRKKIYLSNCKGNVPVNLLDMDVVGTTKHGTSENQKIFGEIKFPYPKPSMLIKYLIGKLELGDEEFIVLDSFAGSGTTAHAVLNMNKEDGGQRKFILCEMSDYAEDITAERVRRVMSGYGDSKNPVEGTGGSFDFFELGETIFDPSSDNLNDNADTEQIKEYVWYSETHAAFAAPGADAHPYLLGSFKYTNYYFYYIKGEETCLDWDFLKTFTERDKAEAYVIYADRCVLTPEELLKFNIVFKKIPRDIKRV